MLINAISLEPLPGAVSIAQRERIIGSVYCHGFLEFFIGSKLFHSCAPLGNYMGTGYPLNAPFLIEPKQNFYVGLGWGDIPLYKRVDIAVYLDGSLVRPSE
jgi:hypothetical protein